MTDDAPSIKNILQKSIEFLERKAVSSPRLSAEWLIADALGYRRLDLYLRQEEIIPEDKLKQLRSWLKRRGDREPWQYIVGHAAFLELDLVVDSRVLIPRPETEELVAFLTNFYKENPPKRFLDLGTGSGAILLSLLKAFPELQGVGVDKSAAALEVAQINAQSIGLADRAEWVESNWWEKIQGSFDGIAANPPYLTSEEVLEAQPEVKDYEPYEALMAKEDGLADLKEILRGAIHHLNPGGHLILEMGIYQGQTLKTYAESLGYESVQVIKDLTKRDRFLWAMRE